MYDSISIRNFRCFKELAVEGLRRVNLVVGKNNAGKSSLLEAIFLLGGATSPVFSLRVGQLRGQRFDGEPPDAMWRALFHDFDPSQPILLEAACSGEPGPRRLKIEAEPLSAFTDFSASESLGAGVARATQDRVIGLLRLWYTDARDATKCTAAIYRGGERGIEAQPQLREDFFDTTYLTARSFAGLAEPAERFSRLMKNKREADVVEALRIVDASIRRLEIVTETGSPTVYADVGLERLVPLAVCGEGVVRLFSIVVELAGSPKGVLLVDELDNGLHYSVMSAIWKTLRALTERHDVQLFATTHNDELIGAALDAYADDLARLGLFRLDRSDGRHRVAAYNAAAMQAVRQEHFEVRG